MKIVIESLLKNGNINLYDEVWIDLDKEDRRFWTTAEGEAERADRKEIAKVIREWKQEQARNKRERGKKLTLTLFQMKSCKVYSLLQPWITSVYIQSVN